MKTGGFGRRARREMRIEYNSGVTCLNIDRVEARRSGQSLAAVAVGHGVTTGYETVTF